MSSTPVKDHGPSSFIAVAGRSTPPFGKYGTITQLYGVTISSLHTGLITCRQCTHSGIQHRIRHQMFDGSCDTLAGQHGSYIFVQGLPDAILSILIRLHPSGTVNISVHTWMSGILQDRKQKYARPFLTLTLISLSPDSKHDVHFLYPGYDHHPGTSASSNNVCFWRRRWRRAY